MAEYKGEERREDYQDNGLSEENGEVVKRVTLITVYRKLKQVDKNQHQLCKQFEEQKKKLEEQEALKEKLEEHLSFCRDFRKENESSASLDDAYSKGYQMAEENAQRMAEERLNRQIKYLAKIIIPSVAILISLLVFLFGYIY